MRAVAIALGLLFGLIAIERFHPAPKPVRRARETHRLTPERPKTTRR